MILDCADAFEVWKTAGKTLNKEGSYVNVGADLTQGVLPVLRRMISYYFRPSWLGGVPRSYKRPGEIASKRNMDELAELVDQNVITPVVDSEYSFEDTVAAYDRVMSNRAMGKVIVRVR
ncbi:hypothetical protein FA10DRAFT_268929 [Acaromyces ingoldii]|uniref:NAD(P)-binding protein n=1 Tax=Acaromyces ingoldii TaxID=215250 RepID=A0A316YM23_9BASI|nr:hypothetical protein FA10DRAFT_268929 [Acaromyces ingoldii]PWN88785.1 hypothetical protein FA10DRAFT_268929 [Acaromyces ingoldii]